MCKGVGFIKFKSLRAEIQAFLILIILSIILLVGSNYSLVNSLNNQDEKLKQINNSFALVNEMKEAFKAKQADSGWFLVLKDDEEAKKNNLENYNNHMQEVIDSEKLLMENSKDILNEAQFKKLDELNKKLDDSFLNGIVKGQDLEVNIEIFKDSID